MSTVVNAAERRREYRLGDFDLATANPDPIAQFAIWFAEAQTAEIPASNAMMLATTADDGRPTVRTVYIRGFDHQGFIFYSLSDSPKGRHLARDPRCALAFHWPELERQVRIEGEVTAIPEADAATFFRCSPIDAKIAVTISRMSSVVADQETLRAAAEQIRSAHPDGDIPVPNTWIGYRVMPGSIEFFQGRANRLHDRLRYSAPDGERWIIDRLAP